MAGNESRSVGKWGEEKALEFLQDKGYTTIEKGFRSRLGEIDIICKSKEYIVFVEVKTRKNKAFAEAREYVSKTKQRKVISAAKYWILKNPDSLQPRFDVIEVYADKGINTQTPVINHIENAFGV